MSRGPDWIKIPFIGWMRMDEAILLGGMCAVGLMAPLGYVAYCIGWLTVG